MSQRPEEILRFARGKKKLKQQDLADKIGITLRQYNKYESGDFPKYKSNNIKAIDMILGTQLYELLYEQKNEFKEDSIRYEAGISLMQELTKDIKQLKATVYILKVTVAQIAATQNGKAIGSMLVELDRAIGEQADRLFEEDKKNQSRV
jgi:transcriptional regulator with XRE-family HTH domain